MAVEQDSAAEASAVPSLPSPPAPPIEEPATGAFSYPNYRRFWFGTLAAVFGERFRFIGSGWLVFELTESPFWLGIVGLTSAIPAILLTVPAGALADRMDNRRLLAVAHALVALSHLAVAGLTVSGLIELWMVLVWAFVVGALTAGSAPAQNAMLPRLINRSAMASAVALNSAIWQGTRVIGPAAAGVLIAVIGTGQSFFVTAVGYTISAATVAGLRLAPIELRANDGGGMLAGLRYVVRHRVFLAVIGLSFFTSLFGSSYLVLLPVFAEDVLDVGVRGFGFMEAAAGLGAVSGTIAMVRLGVGGRIGIVMLAAAGAFGLFIAAFTVSRSLPLSMALLFVAGFCAAIYLNVAMTTLQLLVPDALRGRVMGVWSMTWFMVTVGGFISGSGAELLGAPTMIAIGALAVSAFALAVLLTVPELRALHRDEVTGPAAAR